MTDKRYTLIDLNFFNITTGLPYGEVLDGSTSATFSYSREPVVSNGGVGAAPTCVAAGATTAELAVTFTDNPSFELMQAITGATSVTNSAEPSGATADFVNQLGATVFDATTGIASVAPTSGSEDDLKETTIIIEAASATTVDVIAYSPHDFNRGTDGVYIDADRRTIAEGLTITMGGTTDVPNFGITLTGGSGTIAMVTGNTARLESRPINLGSDTILIGGINDQPKIIGLQAKGFLCNQNNEEHIQTFEFFKIQGGGITGTMTVNEFTGNEWTFIPIVDTTKRAMFAIDGVRMSA